MPEKPDLPDQDLAACLLDAYTLRAAEVTFLPLGADQHTAVYRVVANGRSAYFLKLRSGDFDDSAVAVPRLLCDRVWRRSSHPSLLVPAACGRTSIDSCWSSATGICIPGTCSSAWTAPSTWSTGIP